MIDYTAEAAETRARALTAAMIALAHYNVPTDIQELLLRGNPALGVRPGALDFAVTSALTVLMGIRERGLIEPS